MPAFRVDIDYQGLRTTSWVTDTGEVMREESPLGLMTVRETPERAQGLAVSGRVQADLLQASAVVPVMRQRIDEGRDVRRLQRTAGWRRCHRFDLDGVGQHADGNVIELRDMRERSVASAFRRGRSAEASCAALSHPRAAHRKRRARDPGGSRKALAVPRATASQAERLTRYVNALLDKKPTVSLPSAREVLRTKVGDCNEHTALFVAMARSSGLPARIAVGLVYVHGAFYYHAWPEVFLRGRQWGGGRRGGTSGLWLAVDPTLNQFPADATHLRLLRGGLDRQAAILPLIGRLKMTVLDLELAPEPNESLSGRRRARDRPSDCGHRVADACRRTQRQRKDELLVLRIRSLE